MSSLLDKENGLRSDREPHWKTSGQSPQYNEVHLYDYCNEYIGGCQEKSEVSAKHGMLMWHTIDSDAVLQYLKTKNTPTNCGCVFT